MATPFDDELLADWFIAGVQVPCSGLTITAMGSGPFPEEWFDELLRANSLEVFVASADTDVLIVGTEEWPREGLENLVDQRSGRPLYVYSQEMFLSYWSTGLDPLADRAVAR